ncbi:hypothetical protein [Psychroserpens sp.]
MENSIYDYQEPMFFNAPEEGEEPQDPKPKTEESTVIIKPVKSPEKNPNLQ